MERDRIGLAEVLAAAEEAAPVRSLDVVAHNLRERFGARYVSFLFVDVVGRRLLRVNDEGTAPIRFPWPAVSTTRSCALSTWCACRRALRISECSPR